MGLELQGRRALVTGGSRGIGKAIARVLAQEHLMDAMDVAQVVAFLCSPKSRAINGDAIAAGGGAPRGIHY